MANNYFYILIGASATGKGVLMEQLCSESLWIKATKYSTRSYRGESDDIVNITSPALIKLEKREQELKAIIDNDPHGYDETVKWELYNITYQIQAERLNIIKEHCGNGNGVVYFLNGNYYGIQTDNIPEALKSNNVVVVCSDFNVISNLQSDPNLSQFIRIVYIASTIDERELLRRYKSRECISFDGTPDELISNIQHMSSILSSAGRLKFLSKIEEVMPLLNEQWNNILPYFETIKTRATNIRLLYNRYIDHIAEIDCPVLNFYDLEYMFEQQRHFLLQCKKKRKIESAPIFMVCAAPSSGKATLMNIVGGLGKVNKNIVVTKKYAKREKRPTDGRDGMEAIGRTGNFEDYITDPSDIWSWSFHGSNTEYAIDLSEVRDNITKGIAQIFISNFGQIRKARSLFPKNLIVLYLHATHESSTRNHIYEKRRNDIATEICKKLNCTISEALSMTETDTKIARQVDDAVNLDLSEIKAVHMSYVENNSDVDHVLLNTGTNNDLIEQMVNLISAYTRDIYR